MRRAPAMTFRTALNILGHHDGALLGKIDNLLGGVVLAAGVAAIAGPAATVLVAAAAWGWVDQKNEAVGLVRKLLASVSDRKLKLARYERTELMAAAHTVLVASAAMEVFQEEIGSRLLRQLSLDRAAEYNLLVRDFGQRVLDGLYDNAVPFPSGGRGFRDSRKDVQEWLSTLVNRLVDLYYSNRLPKHSEVQRADLIERAEKRYRSRFYELAAKVPEFAMWMLLGQRDAGQAELRELHHGLLQTLQEQSRALSRFEAVLTVLTADGPRPELELAEIVRRSALEELDKSIVPQGTARFAHHRKIEFPSIRDIYIEPSYRWTLFDDRSHISDERWWQERTASADLSLRLAAFFASPVATRLPLLVLGHPGAGKSLLTKVLAARLPDVAFTAVRVPLRHVPAGAPIYLQVQEALNRATHGRVAWHALTEQSVGTLRVVLLDGLDELLQAAEHGRSSFLDEVVEFQRTEAAQQRPVIVIVTSRTVVADRVSVPPDTTVIKLEEFNANQVEQWRLAWNSANESGIASGIVRALSAEAASSSGELNRQPLLLLMVALYSADPAVPPIESGLSSTMLYRRLMENFAWRENAKPERRQAEELPEFVWKLLHQLSVAAFAMFNRGRQDVTDAELGDDLFALEAVPTAGRRTEAARQLTGQFFFIYTAQSAVENDQTYYSYEFLHATLGEYLIARAVVEAVCDAAESMNVRRGHKEPDDDLLFALLSHQCLATRRSILAFIADSLAALDEIERGRIRLALDKLIAHCRRRHDSGRYSQYRPSTLDQVKAVAAYSANLVLLKVLDSRDGMALYEVWSANSESMWGSTLSLWRAGLDENGWLSMLTSLSRVDTTIYFRNQPATLTLWNSELLHTKLRDDTQNSLFLEMGAEIRMNPAYQITGGFRAGTYHRGRPIEAAEELARWLFQALLMEIPGIDEDRLAQLLLRPYDERFPYHVTLVSMLLKQRSHLLPYGIVRILVRSLPPTKTEQYAVLVAIIAHPTLIDDLPKLADPDRYSGLAGVALMIEACDEGTRFALAGFFDAILERHRKKRTSVQGQAASLLRAFSWYGRDSAGQPHWQSDHPG